MTLVFLNNKLTAKSGKMLIGWIIVEQFSKLMIAQFSERRIHIAADVVQRLKREWFSQTT